MEALIYGITVVLTIVWSVWNDALWRTRIGLDEGSPARMINVAGPSVYFLLVAVAGWRTGASLRLDLIGLMVLDATIAVSTIAVAIVLRVKLPGRRKGYLWVLSLYNLVAISVTIFALAVGRSPILLIRLSALVEDMKGIDLFSLAWAGVEGTNGERDITGLLNKVLIALLSYVPVSIVRIAAAARQKQRILREISQLSVRMRRIEESIHQLESDKEHSNT